MTTFTIEQAAAAAAYYWDQGYAVFKQVWTPAEIAEAHAATDRVKARGLAHGQGYRHGNQVYWHVQDPHIGPNIIGMQWPSYDEPLLEAMRRDPRMLRILEPLIGRNARQIINQLHWKTPGCQFLVNFHRDRENRKPDEAFRDLATSYIQTGTAIDPMTPENGALLVIPNSHRRPATQLKRAGQSNFGGGDWNLDMLANEGYSEADLVPVYAEPGDVALWHVDTIHGSARNDSATLDRCLYINGYVDARNCLRGHWAFINGQGVPLPPIDVPVLVQRDDIFDHLTPEYPEGPMKARD